MSFSVFGYFKNFFTSKTAFHNCVSFSDEWGSILVMWVREKLETALYVTIL